MFKKALCLFFQRIKSFKMFVFENFDFVGNRQSPWPRCIILLLWCSWFWWWLGKNQDPWMGCSPSLRIIRGPI